MTDWPDNSAVERALLCFGAEIWTPARVTSRTRYWQTLRNAMRRALMAAEYPPVAELVAERAKVERLRKASSSALRQLKPFVDLADEVSLHEVEAQGRLWDAAWGRAKRAVGLLSHALAETEEGQ